MGTVLDSAGTQERDEPGVPMAVLGWGATAAGFLSTAAADELDDLILTTRRAYHLVRQFEDGADHPLVIYLRLDRRRANLALARRELAAVRLWPDPTGPGHRGIPALPPGTAAPPARSHRVRGAGTTFAAIPSPQVNRPAPMPMPKSAPAPDLRSASPDRAPAPSPPRRPSPVPRNGAGPSPPNSSPPGQTPVLAQRSPMPRPLQRRPVALSAQPLVMSAPPNAAASINPLGQRPAGLPRWANDVSTLGRLITALRNMR
ncbi:MAG TPA: hypothetical protein VGH89_35930 [Pseudonocardia sp.]